VRAGMVGLSALYWPQVMAKGLGSREGVCFAAAATLGATEEEVRGTLASTPREYAQQHGINLYTDAEEMVHAEKLDTVVLATRHTDHARWAERMAALGMNIFIPKTFATTLQDAHRIVEARNRHRVQIAVGPSARFLPEMVSVKEALKRGRIGRPFAARLCHHHGTIDVFGAKDWYREEQEGGPELSLAWYGIDLISHLFDGRIETVFAEYGNFTSPGSPFMDCGRICMSLQGGATASFDMYFCNRMSYPSWQLEIVGPRGIAAIRPMEGDPTKPVASLDTESGHERLPRPDAVPNWETFWIDDLLAGREPALSVEYALAVTEVSLAARESARTGHPVTLAGAGS
jgi:predicted dehydrogenase